MYFQRGTLTADQMKLVLRDLPMDISFADENDMLVCWNGATYKTCDARSIGRDVRDDRGTYKAILEVNHDATGVRALEGAQRLPAW